MGLLGLISNHPVSLHIVSPGYEHVHAIYVCVVVYDGHYAKGLALRLIAILWLYFMTTVLGLIGDNREGHAMRVLGVTRWPRGTSTPLFTFSPAY
jgi:hypothetical protein